MFASRKQQQQKVLIELINSMCISGRTFLSAADWCAAQWNLLWAQPSGLGLLLYAPCALDTINAAGARQKGDSESWKCGYGRENPAEALECTAAGSSAALALPGLFCMAEQAAQGNPWRVKSFGIYQGEMLFGWWEKLMEACTRIKITPAAVSGGRKLPDKEPRSRQKDSSLWYNVCNQVCVKGSRWGSILLWNTQKP